MCWAALFCCSTQVFGAATTQPTTGKADFLQQSASAGLAIVQLTMIASSKADAPETRNFANDVLERQANLNTKIKAAAQNEGLPPPGMQTAAQQQQLDDVSHQYGRLLDRAFLKQLIALQTQLLNVARTEQQHGKFGSLAAQIISVADLDIAQARGVADQIGVKLTDESTGSPP